MLWLAVLIRILCCLIPATTAFCLLPRGGPSDAVSDFQADIVSAEEDARAQRIAEAAASSSTVGYGLNRTELKRCDRNGLPSP
jgi:hypothetical protein